MRTPSMAESALLFQPSSRPLHSSWTALPWWSVAHVERQHLCTDSWILGGTHFYQSAQVNSVKFSVPNNAQNELLFAFSSAMVASSHSRCVLYTFQDGESMRSLLKHRVLLVLCGCNLRDRDARYWSLRACLFSSRHWLHDYNLRRVRLLPPQLLK